MSAFSGYVVFAKVFETGSFTAAADALGMTKSAASKHVSKLENRLDARLFDRTTRRLRPTEVGAAFYERCVRILAEIEEAESAVSQLHSEPRGTLRVSAPMSFGIQHLSRVLPAFMEMHSALEVDLSLNDRIVDLMDEGVDVAVRIADLPDSSLIARRIAPARSRVCASPDYWRRHGMPEKPEDLHNHECLIYKFLATQNTWRFATPDGPRTLRVNGRFRADNGDVLREAAAAGLGVTYAPTFILGDDIRAGRLQMALQRFEAAPLGIYAVYPQNRHLSAKVRVFVDYLAGCFGPTPYWDDGL